MNLSSAPPGSAREVFSIGQRMVVQKTMGILAERETGVLSALSAAGEPVESVSERQIVGEAALNPKFHWLAAKGLKATRVWKGLPVKKGIDIGLCVAEGIFSTRLFAAEVAPLVRSRFGIFSEHSAPITFTRETNHKSRSCRWRNDTRHSS